MEIPREELKEVIDRFEKDIEIGVSSRNWLPYLAKIRTWLESGPTPVAADAQPSGIVVRYCIDCTGKEMHLATCKYARG